VGGVGFEPETREDLLAWIRQEQHPVVLLTLQGAGDAAALLARPGVVVIGVPVRAPSLILSLDVRGQVLMSFLVRAHM
jgi:hypothetical protein